MCGGLTPALLTLPSWSDSALADARLTLDPLRLDPMTEANLREQRLVLASQECHAEDDLDVIGSFPTPLRLEEDARRRTATTYR